MKSTTPEEKPIEIPQVPSDDREPVTIQPFSMGGGNDSGNSENPPPIVIPQVPPTDRERFTEDVKPTVPPVVPPQTKEKS